MHEFYSELSRVLLAMNTWMTEYKIFEYFFSKLCFRIIMESLRAPVRAFSACVDWSQVWANVIVRISFHPLNNLHIVIELYIITKTLGHFPLIVVRKKCVFLFLNYISLTLHRIGDSGLYIYLFRNFFGFVYLVGYVWGNKSLGKLFLLEVIARFWAVPLKVLSEQIHQVTRQVVYLCESLSIKIEKAAD